MNISRTTEHPSSTDRIEKTLVLHAPRSRVWRALTDPTAFGQWFGVNLKGTFVPGKRSRGPVTIPEYAHLMFEIDVEQMEPERLFSWRWQPGGDPDIDPAEPTTLVVFRLEEVAEGTRLSVTETGFDRLPVARRARACRENNDGWTGQMENLRKHLARSA
jgi:uncharacterized protein YndB with AHSA1/START domain